MPQPVRTEADRPDQVRKLEVTSIGDDFLKDQIEQKDTQIGELNDQVRRRDEQIMTLLKRDRETNVLIKGLQHTLWHSLGIEPPRQPDQGEVKSGAGMPPPRDV